MVLYFSNGSLCLGDTITTTNFPDAVTCPADASGKVLTQMLWPDHCIQNQMTGPASSKLDAELHREAGDVIVTKGMDCKVDFYSAFYDNGHFNMTTLHPTLASAGIDTVFITGLALDYCVKYTAVDAKDLGYDVYIVKDATRGVDKGSSEQALVLFTQKDIHVIDSMDLSGILLSSGSAVTTFSSALIIAICASVYLTM